MNRNAWWAKTKPASQKGGKPFGRPAPECPPYRAALAADPQFRAACAVAGVDPTRRQASRFRHKRGQAWAAHTRSKSLPPIEVSQR